jgi:NADPH2:quinone reductase
MSGHCPSSVAEGHTKRPALKNLGGEKSAGHFVSCRLHAMKAILAAKRGGPEVLELRDVPEPTLTAGQVLIDVEAAGVNFADTVQTQGMYPQGPRPPYIPGLEFAGKVRGSGKRVMGLTHTGACAQVVAAHPASLLEIPEPWTAAEAAAFPVNYFTAWFAYWMAGFIEGARGKKVLIHAVAGGVGTAAVELGALLGAEMYGTASSDEKLAKVKELGLHHAINYKNSDYVEEIAKATGGRGVDAAFEMLGGEHTAMTTRCLGDLGRLIVYGMATGKTPVFDFLTMFQRNISMHTLWLTPLTANLEMMRHAYAQLSAWSTSGKVRPVVGHELPLEQAADAHKLLLERKNYGKVVLKT